MAWQWQRLARSFRGGPPGPGFPTGSRLGVLAATPFAVMVALVALSWSASGSSNPSTAMRIVVALVVASGVVHLLGYNPFADPDARSPAQMSRRSWTD